MSEHAPARTTRRTLPNGMQVVAVPDHAAPLVAVNLWYAVGSRDEVAGRTGFAHLFEHLMFQGSANVHGTEHFSYVQGVGGSLNGTTSFDRTNYYETLPKHAVELGLWLEADRLESLALTQENLDNQRDVVKNERRQRYDNVPYGTSWEQLVAMAFPTGHPYHHLPIGSMEDLDAASLADTKAFFAEHYRPANAVLTLAGDLRAEEAFELAERHFGDLPRSERRARTEAPPLPTMEEEVRRSVVEDVPLDRLYMAWRVPPAPSRESLAVELALAVLAEGASSRLTSRLVRKDEVAHSVSGFNLGTTSGTDLAVLVLSTRTGKENKEVEAAAREEVTRLAAEGPTETELARARAQHHRHILETISSVESLADAVSRATTLFDDPDHPFSETARAAEVTADDVQAAAGRLLAPCATLEYTTTAPKTKKVNR